MKTYFFDTLNRYKRFSEKLDAKTTLCNKTWWIFNDHGEKETYIFQKDGTLIISLKGKVKYSKWEYISANHSVIINSSEGAYMFVLFYGDDNVLALQVDGTEEYAFLVNEQKLKQLVLNTYNDLVKYFEAKEKYLGTETPSNKNTSEEYPEINVYKILAIIFINLILLLLGILQQLKS